MRFISKPCLHFFICHLDDKFFKRVDSLHDSEFPYSGALLGQSVHLKSLSQVKQ